MKISISAINLLFFYGFSIEQEGNNFLTTDTDPSFDVPIILRNDGLESFADSSLTGSNDEPLSDDINEFSLLDNDIKPNTSNCSSQETMDYEETKEFINPVVDSADANDKSDKSEEETKSDQRQNLKVTILNNKFNFKQTNQYLFFSISVATAKNNLLKNFIGNSMSVRILVKNHTNA